MRENWRKLTWVFSLILAAVLVGHWFFWSSSNIFTKNDLDANLLQIEYIKLSGFKIGWNPYINLPVWNDPLLGILNPFWATPLLALPAQSGVKTAYFASLMMCGLGVYFLARSRKVDSSIAVVAAMTFLVSGFPAARIIAGQSEKVMSLAFLPWILYLLLNKRNFWLSAIFMTMPLFTGDVYTYLYSLAIALVLGKWREIMGSIILGLMRLGPIWQITPFLYKPIEPLLGTQNLLSISYHLFFPVKYLWNKLHLFGWIPQNFGWWEKSAYIGVLPFFGLWAKDARLRAIALILVLISMPGWVLNPIYWVIKISALGQMFHVPSRVFGYLSLVILILAAVKIKNKYLWIGNLVFCLCLTWFAYLNRSMPKVMPGMTEALNYVAGHKHHGEVLAFDQLNAPIYQTQAQAMGIEMLATNYGVMLKNTPAEKWLKFRLGEAGYTGTKPEYIIYPKSYIFDLLKTNYEVVFQSGEVQVFQKI